MTEEMRSLRGELETHRLEIETLETTAREELEARGREREECALAVATARREMRGLSGRLEVG
jgi:hypothetical protein